MLQNNLEMKLKFFFFYRKEACLLVVLIKIFIFALKSNMICL